MKKVLTFSSWTEEFTTMCSFSFSTVAKLIECMSVVHDIGEGQTLCCSETADPNASDPTAEKTEVGDSVSFSATNEFGDGDLSD